MNRKAKLPSFWRRHAGLFLGLGLVVFLFHDLFGPRGLLTMRRQQKELSQLQQEIRRLQEENRRVAEEIEALKTDPKTVERIAREEMGLAKPNELVFRLPEEPRKPAEPNTPKK